MPQIRLRPFMAGTMGEDGRYVKVAFPRFPDAVQRVSGAPLFRDRPKLGACNDPGSAAHHYVLRRARETALFAG
jgi:hypothetical protein